MARGPSFGNLIRNTRNKRGMSASEVAERVGVSIASICPWETDRGRPRDSDLSELCKILKLPIRATKELATA